MILSPVLVWLSIAAAVAIGIAIFSLSRKVGGSIFSSAGASLIGIVLFLAPIVGGVFVGPITLGQASFLSMSVAPPFLTGLIALGAGLIGLQALTGTKYPQAKL